MVMERKESGSSGDVNGEGRSRGVVSHNRRSRLDAGVGERAAGKVAGWR